MSDEGGVGVEPGSGGGGSSRTAVWALVVGGVAVAIAVIALVVAIVDDDDQRVATTSTTTSSSSSTTTEPTTTSTTSTTSTTTTSSTSTTSTTTTEPPSTTSTIPSEITPAVWPWFASDVRYEDPVDAAQGFAEDYLGMEEPLVGEYLAGDNRSGEVEVQAEQDGAVTVVFVRQLSEDDLWWVIGSATENIEIDEPEVLDMVQSPMTSSGRARAFEGTVLVEIRVDGRIEPLAESVITTGGGTELESFEFELPFSEPDSGWGAVVFYTSSPETGQVHEAGVIRIQFS